MSLRKAFFRLHLGVGLAAGAFLASMAASGILLAFAPQIIAFSERGVSRAALAEGPRRELAQLLSVAATSPPGTHPSGITLRRDPGASAAVGLGEDGTIFLDTRSGRIVGPGSRARTFFGCVEHWHRWLGSREIGKPFTGSAALALVLLSLSGLWLWRPRGRTAPKASLALRGGMRGRVLHRERHHAIGFWTSPLWLILALTGTVMAYRWAGNLPYTLTGRQAPKEAGGARGDGAEPAPEGRGKPAGADRGTSLTGNLHVSLDSLAAWADARAPAWTSLSLRAPRKPGGSWTGSLEEPGFAAFPRRSQFSLDGETGAVSGWQPFAERPAGRKLRAWSMSLHTGRGFGWPGQVLAVVAALALLSQIWTGNRMAWRRFSRRASHPGAIPPKAESFGTVVRQGR